MSNSVAVVLVNFHSEELLSDALAALRRQTLQPQRVIVVDNGGPGGLADRVVAFYPGVEVVDAGGNVGFAAANNLAMRLTFNCKWIALLNVDAFPEPDWLERLIRATTEQPECQFFGGALISARDPSVLDGTGDVYHVSGRTWRRDGACPIGDAQETAVGTIGPCAAAALYRRDALIDVGGFDERFFCYMEDVDLALRLRLAGYRYGYVPDAKAHHLGSAVTGVHSDFSVYYGHRNFVWAYVKNMPGRLFWWYLPQHLMMNLLAIFYFATRGQLRPILRAKRDAIRNFPELWRTRGVVQRGRRISIEEFSNCLQHGVMRPFRHQLNKASHQAMRS